MAQATSTKAPIAKIADKISGYFVPIVMIIAAVSFLIWLMISKNVATAINIFVSVLVVACPCSLGLATSLAIVIASGNASKRGILIKSSESLENAHKIKTICFDKTGTLTKGQLSISKIYNYGKMDEKSLINRVASLEKKSEHPIAKAIVNSTNKDNGLAEVTEFKAIAGYGIEGKINDDIFIIGNRKLMEKKGIAILEQAIKDEQALADDGNSILFVAVNDEIVALIGVRDILKDGVSETIEKLKNQNIDVVMITGDNEKTARKVAAQIGIENVISNVTPKEKAEEIKRLKQKGLVMMCGDGINDSVSLVTADIGVSVSTGTDIAMDSAQVVIMSDDIEKINELIEISRKTIRNIKQNLFWAFFYNICMIPIACGILKPWGITLNPMIAAFSMTLSSLSVVLNALRLS